MSTYSDIPIRNSLFLSQEELIKLKNEYPPGTRVRLLQMDDSQAPPPGCLGTVTGVDDTGSLLMKWDNGSGLNVIYKEDKVEKIKDDNV